MRDFQIQGFKIAFITNFIKRIFSSCIGLLLDCKNYFCYQKYYLFEQRLALDYNSISAPTIKDFSLQIVPSPLEMDALLSSDYKISSFSFSKDFKQSLERGAALFFIFIGKTLAHASMVTLKSEEAFRLGEIFQRINYDDAGYIGLCYTHPLYRGKGIYPYVLSEICSFIKKNGKSRALISSKVTNRSSVRGITKAGFSVSAEVGYLRLLFLKLYKIRTPRVSQRVDIGADRENVVET